MTDDVGDDVVAELAALAARPDLDGDAARRLEFVVDLLIQRGHLAPGHKRLLGKVRADRPAVRLAVFRDKRSLPSPDIDCLTLLPLCRGRCCTMTVSLSAEDIDERQLRWDLAEPYVLPKAPGGYCTHTAADGGCTVYADRPGVCRVYDCREDRRVWLDWEAKVPAPMPERLSEPPDLPPRAP